MRELRGDLFDPQTYKLMHGYSQSGSPDYTYIYAVGHPDAICISTNGSVKKSGEAVMGKGCARRAAELMPGLPSILGQYLAQGMNIPLCHGPWNGMIIVTFPVKPVRCGCNTDKSNVVKYMRKRFEPGDTVPGWACVACPLLIRHSAHDLAGIADERNWNCVVLPRVGTGCGELEWEDVRSILEKELDDRFFAITF